MQVLVTKQTGPAGKPVNTLYIAKKMKLANEMYFAILLDRATAGPIIIACSEGAGRTHPLLAGTAPSTLRTPVDGWHCPYAC
jgi:succinyl-CoA synthetase beta subunit